MTTGFKPKVGLEPLGGPYSRPVTESDRLNFDDRRLQRAPMLYPPIEPYDCGFMDVDNGHRIYWETCGNPQGKPALFVHGGPGGGSTAFNRRLFNPERYRIILFDQRGCGHSIPHASLIANTTTHLVGDIETLRVYLNVDSWLIAGGSWGATLALLYAQNYPHRVQSMVLRGVFTARESELRWLYKRGASFIFPDAWEDFLAPIPINEQHDLVAAYYSRLTCGDPDVEARAALAWCLWEESLMLLERQPTSLVFGDKSLLALARIESHFFMHKAFVEEGQLIRNAAILGDIPAVIVQGRYDAVTPLKTAWDLHKVWPQAELHIVEGAGHATSEPDNLRRLIQATDKFSG